MTVGATPGAEDATGERAAERVDKLQDENAQLQEAIHAHAVVDQAIGVIIVLGHLTPKQGWNVLKETSQRTNIKLRHVAEHIVESAHTGQLRPTLRTELQQQIKRLQSPHTPG